MKVLNLDKVQTKSDVKIVLDDEDHYMRVFSLGEMIDQLKKANQVAKAEDAEDDRSEADVMAEFYEELLTSIADAFPSLTKERLREMPDTHIRAIFEFINTAAETQVEEGAKSTGKSKPQKRTAKK